MVPPRQHPPAERAVGDGRDAQLAAVGEQVRPRGVFDVEREGGVFDLDGVDGRGAVEGSGGAFGEAEVAFLARGDGGGRGGDDGFDGDFAVGAVAAGRGLFVSVLDSVAGTFKGEGKIGSEM